MAKYRNPATLLNEDRGNSVYRKGVRYIHVDAIQAICFMKGKPNGQDCS
jgi:hypothetical protein